MRLGLSADEVLKLRGRSADHAIHHPTVLGEDGGRFVVAWHYDDCDVIFKHRLGHYRVTEVLEMKRG